MSIEFLSRKTSRRILVAFLALAPWLGQTAFAETMSFYFENAAAYSMQVQLNDTTGNRFYPGFGSAWNLNKRGQQSVSITCFEGHQICYGAWNKGNRQSYWGAGYNNERSCSKCCWTCADKREIRVPRFVDR